LTEITRLLQEWGAGDPAALERLTPLVYAELRRLAQWHLRREHHPDAVLAPTVLVHEAYLKLVDQHVGDWQNRAHFFGVAAGLMRRILLHEAEKRKSLKRGGGMIPLPLHEDIPEWTSRGGELDELDAALNRLAQLDPRQARVIELRFFGGLSVEESAEVLGLSPRTVKREWATARLWLRRELSREGPLALPHGT
jgi:RNA polymerase sigma factor (TIGR02999 family)